MNAKQHLVDAYNTWEQLTLKEGAAIASEDWFRVSECQHGKQDLQRRIIQLTEAAHAECVEAGLDPKHFESDLRRIVNSLIALETRNSELIAGRRQAAEAARLELDRASNNLRRVQKSYSPPAQAVWNSYS
jgi:hypothetical protein